MKILDRIVAILMIVVLGGIHGAASPVFHGHYDMAGMWWLSGGLMFMLIGIANLVRIASPTAAARVAAMIANVFGLVFCVALVPLLPLRSNPQVVLSIILFATGLLFSLLRREATSR